MDENWTRASQLRAWNPLRSKRCQPTKSGPGHSEMKNRVRRGAQIVTQGACILMNYINMDLQTQRKGLRIKSGISLQPMPFTASEPSWDALAAKIVRLAGSLALETVHDFLSKPAACWSSTRAK